MTADFNARERFLRTMALKPVDRLPYLETDMAKETIAAWQKQGLPRNASIEAYFGLDHEEGIPVKFRKLPHRKLHLTHDSKPEKLCRYYNPGSRTRFPPFWKKKANHYQNRNFILFLEPWNEGLFQILGIRDTRTFFDVMLTLKQSAAKVHQVMEHYANFLEAMIKKVTRDFTPDYAIFYEPIADNKGPLMSPSMFRTFVIPYYQRVLTSLQRAGINFTIVWSSGNIVPLIPLWLEVGICGVAIDQACRVPVDYVKLRKEYGPDLRLVGGIDSWVVRDGPFDAIDRELRRIVLPLLESGGYIPMLDDTIRPYIPFRHYAYYRQSLHRIMEKGA